MLLLTWYIFVNLNYAYQENLPDIISMLEDNCSKYEGPMSDLSGHARGKSESQKNPKQGAKKMTKRRD